MATYAKAHHNQFVTDAEAASLIVFTYKGRYLYNGPAVRTSDVDAVKGITSVVLNYEIDGSEFIVYPNDTVVLNS